MQTELNCTGNSSQRSPLTNKADLINIIELKLVSRLASLYFQLDHNSQIQWTCPTDKLSHNQRPPIAKERKFALHFVDADVQAVIYVLDLTYAITTSLLAYAMETSVWTKEGRVRAVFNAEQVGGEMFGACVRLIGLLGLRR